MTKPWHELTAYCKVCNLGLLIIVHAAYWQKSIEWNSFLIDEVRMYVANDAC